MRSMRGIPVVLSGPSGVGKGTVASLLMNMGLDMIRSVSMTTRPPRPGEREGVDYFFTDPAAFEEAIDRNQLVEWAKVYQHYYGTPKHFLEKQFELGHDALLDIDVQGAAAILTLYQEGIFIYLLPPSLEELRRRLHSRAKGEGDDLDFRFNQALREMRFIEMYDYAVINDDPQRAAEECRAIIQSNRLRVERRKPWLRDLGLLT